jgi:hypothetical protein
VMVKHPGEGSLTAEPGEVVKYGTNLQSCGHLTSFDVINKQ